jgi:uncharacterized protein (TIGR00255 family)
MIKSMTGFGRGETSIDSMSISVEIKSVNSKGFNITTKLPESILSYEQQIINYIKSRIKRGQITIVIELNKNNSYLKSKVVVDHDLAKEYWRQLESLRDELSFTDPIDLITLAGFPGVITVEESKEDVEQIWSSIYQALVMATDQLIHTRETEGSAMLLDITKRLDEMKELIDIIKNRSPLVIEEYRQRLQKRIEDMMQNQLIDESRLAMEVAMMADKCDITEELVRLRSHISQMEYYLNDTDESIGRQLDFILQEINREVNTISSKANDYQISANCIQLKYEIEKVREQAQNIE